MRGVRRLTEVPAGEVIRAKGRNAAGVNGSKSQKKRRRAGLRRSSAHGVECGLGDVAFGFGAFELGFDPLEAVAFGSRDARLRRDEGDAGAVISPFFMTDLPATIVSTACWRS